MSLKGERSPSRRAFFTIYSLLLAGLGTGALVSPSTSGGLARPGTEGPGPDSSEQAVSLDLPPSAASASVVRAALPAEQGATLAEGVAATSPAALALRGSGRIAPAPPESAFVRQVDPASIPPEVMERLWIKRTEREREKHEKRASSSAPPLPPVDPSVPPAGIVRPLGPDRIIHGAHPDEVPLEAERRLRSRIETSDRGNR